MIAPGLHSERQRFVSTRAQAPYGREYKSRNAPRACHRRRRIDAAGPARDDLELVFPDGLPRRDMLCKPPRNITRGQKSLTLERYMMTLAPLGAIAYLCTSHEILRGPRRSRIGGDGQSDSSISCTIKFCKYMMETHLVTPGTRKSNGTVLNPAFSRKGTRNEPRQQSTCRPRPCFIARSESAEMSERHGAG